MTRKVSESKKAWAISLGLIFIIIAVSFGIAYYAVPDDQKPPIIDNNDTKPIPKPDNKTDVEKNETKPNPKPDNNETKPPIIIIIDDNDTKPDIIIPPEIFPHSFNENTTLKS